ISFRCYICQNGGRRKITITESDTTGFDKSKVECYNCHKIGHFTRECRGPKNQDSRNKYQNNSRRTVNVEETPPKAMVAIDGVCFDWSYMAEDEVPTNMALMAFSYSEGQITDKSKNGLRFQSYNVVPPPATLVYNTGRCPHLKTDLSYSSLEEFKQPQFESYRPKSSEIESKNDSKDIPYDLKEQTDAPLVKDRVLTAITIKGKRGGAKVGRITGKGTLKTATKNETTCILKKFITKIENLVDKKVKVIRCDNKIEFKNSVMNDFYAMKGIIREFSIARTPQQNGVAKKRNRTLIEAARTMLSDSKLPTTFWAKAVNTACYVQNRLLVVKPYNKTPYELFRGRTHALSFMRPFGCHVTILNTLDHLGKFDRKFDDGFFVGYSLNSKAFRVYNLKTRKVEENLHIRFLEDKPSIAGTEESIGEGHSSKEKRSSQDYILMPLWKDGLLFNYSLKNASNDEPQPSSDARHKDDEGLSKESEIDNQEKSENSTQDVNTVGLNINTVSTNDNTEVDMSNITTAYQVPTTPNTRIHKDHSLDHMDVKSAFIYERFEEEVYMCQPLGFEDPNHPDKVYKVVKTLYGLHQASRAWYETLAKYLLGNRFHRGKIDQTLFIKRKKGDILLVHVYVDDIIFGSTKKELCTEFKRLMKDKFQMNSMRELTFFLGLQVKQKEDGIFISQDKYVTEVLRKFNFLDVKSASTPVDMEKTLVKEADGDDLDVHLYRSMIGSLMYLTTSRPDIIQVKVMLKHKEIYVTPSHTKKIFANMKRQVKDFSEAKVQEAKKMITEVPQLSDSTHDVADKHVTITSNDPLLSGSSIRVESFEDAGLGDQEDTSKQGRMIADLDADVGVALVDETHGRND
nr:copia protein [Tanacetum cinerariifolium]